jgi:hypothetical protein
MGSTTVRTTVVHLHLFKNAGTTVERGLQAHFGERWASFDKPTAAARISQAELMEFLRINPSLHAVSSHHLRPPLENGPTMRWLPVLFLRHPIDRIRSAYEFERGQGCVTSSSKAAALMSLSDWVQFHREKLRSTQCRNFQTFALTSVRQKNGRPVFHEPTRRHLHSARSFVKELPAFGLVESFDESWNWISQWIRDYYPDFRPKTGWANATTVEGDVLEQRLERMRADMGDTAFEQLLVENEADLALYRWASKRARNRWA